jgi:TolB-like protein/Tfp pilus assembly protein PilF/tRNA A-37 threonylcarbamoyl transferase component Bud32
VTLLDQLTTALSPTYTIERELGGGGMSRVFLATERSLGRQVVVKVLPDEITGQVSMERFRREIAVAAQLQHPHIVPLLAAGEVDGVPYFTMPYVKGDSLRARIARHGELPVSDAVRVLREVASALAFAHDGGVIHRDIKPDNILLSGGSAMVTDFGVAKALSASTNASARGLTSLGVALGTPAYMSPEQASADPMVDHRADVYAWGITAYELLTGSTPFGGRPAAAMLAAHTTEAVESPDKRRAGLPPALVHLVMRCLEKRPADRPQSAAELVRELDAITTSSGGLAPAERSLGISKYRRAAVVVVAGVLVAAAGIAWVLAGRRHRPVGDAGALAVLPFDVVGGDSSFDYVAEGLSDELRSQLTGIAGLRVKARGSSVALRGRHVDLAEIGAKLGVSRVLQGSVRASANQLRVTAELVEVGDGSAVWSHTFDGAEASLATVKDSITRAIVGALRLRLTQDHSDAGPKPTRGTADAEAYALLLKGNYYRYRFANREAIDNFQQAVTRDPRFARAWADLALTYAQMPGDGVTPTDSALQLALKYSARALELDSTLVDAYSAQAFARMLIYRLPEADAAYQRALQLEPDNSEAINGHAQILIQRGKVDEALATLERARTQDPLSTYILVNIQYLLFSLGRLRESIDVTKAILDIDPNATFALQNLALAYANLGRKDSATWAIDRVLKADSSGSGAPESAMLVFAATGQWDRVDQLQRRVEHEKTNSPHFGEFHVRLVNGDFDGAVDAAERGLHAHEGMFGAVFLGCDPSFDPLKTRPRYVALMKEIGVAICPPVRLWPISPRHPAAAR